VTIATEVTGVVCDRETTPPVVTVRFAAEGQDREVRLTHFSEHGIDGFRGDATLNELELGDPDAHHQILSVVWSAFRGDALAFPIAIKRPPAAHGTE